MNGSRQIEVHYINTGFPYTITESFMDLFEDLSYTQANMFIAEASQDQGNLYWPMVHANLYKYGFSGSYGNSYYNFGQLYELNDYAPRLDGGRRVWENPLPSSNVELPLALPDGSGEAEITANTDTYERVRANNNTRNPQQYIWQDRIDPDSMTYEELLDLGESVGSQSRGLSRERISSLPVTKYKCSFFLRKKKQTERCVICQMDYKRRDRQMTLPCKHVYHSICVSRWLSINKACPICLADVPTDQSRQ